MPEGHTIHRLARDHHNWLAGATVEAQSPQGRFADGAAAVDGSVLDRVEAHGKHLLYRFGPTTLHVHLGLFGRYRRYVRPAPAPRDSTRLLLRGEQREVHLIGPTCCELINEEQRRALHDRLGPDPLREDADPEKVWAKLQRSRRPIGAVLLDQSVIAGVGNVYRAELLFLAGVWPELPAKELPRERFDHIWQDSVRLLQLGVKTNRIITVPREESGKAPSKTRKHERVYVYKRRSCRRCEGPVVWSTIGNRNAYACPQCQPLGVA